VQNGTAAGGQVAMAPTSLMKSRRLIASLSHLVEFMSALLSSLIGGVGIVEPTALSE
jgi:hypothetical protein